VHRRSLAGRGLDGALATLDRGASPAARDTSPGGQAERGNTIVLRPALVRGASSGLGKRTQPDRRPAKLCQNAAYIFALAPFLHYGGADENAPLLVIVGIGVLVGLFLAWRRR